MVSDTGVDIDNEAYTAPPGEEGLDISHEGGEYEAFEGLSEQVASLSSYHYVDSRTRHDHIELQMEQWSNQLDRLVNAYLDYRSCDRGDGLPCIPEANVAIDGSNGNLLTDINLVDIFGHQRMSFQPPTSHHYPNEMLIYHGYLGCSPLYPTVAISIRTLASYHQYH
ncbi:uncharacterized protein HD556DRAFT_1238113 [Suillus plorans]|uniref:Uncharacterized protein n=1 Tax=Suillus plorans TaxID=116603 RepID=A0A9P7ANS4_9AGAM|nr:uncharacterized protein HD556DRAFT_1238113 [Suillus plorans]KAG1793277.1 hypothetical protein HD556DRAFT_1238113 [Suillus plorans]